MKPRKLLSVTYSRGAHGVTRPTDPRGSIHCSVYLILPLVCLAAALPANLLAQPVITQQPQSQTVNACGTASFSVSVSSGTSVSYQWRFNGGSIPGATASSYSFSNVQLPQAGAYSVACTNAGGFAISTNAVLTVNAPNLVPAQPTGWSDKIVVSTTTGTSTDSNPLTTTNTLYVDFAIQNIGSASTCTTFSNELYLDGVLQATFTVGPPFPANPFVFAQFTDYPLSPLSAGSHMLKIKVDSGNQVVESNEGDNQYTKIITVVALPAITSQPQSETVVAGSDATNFAVTATGSPPLKYQWRFNGTNIAGATNSSYSLLNVQSTNAGSYSVVVTNVGGAVTSSNAILTVVTTLLLSPVGFVSNGFRMTVTGPAFVSVIIDGATNLNGFINWNALSTNNTGAGGSFTFTDTSAFGLTRRFYRARQ